MTEVTLYLGWQLSSTIYGQSNGRSKLVFCVVTPDKIHDNCKFGDSPKNLSLYSLCFPYPLIYEALAFEKSITIINFDEKNSKMRVWSKTLVN